MKNIFRKMAVKLYNAEKNLKAKSKFHKTFEVALRIYNDESYSQKYKRNALQFLCRIIKNDIIYDPVIECVYMDFPYDITGVNHDLRNARLLPVEGILDAQGKEVKIKLEGISYVMDISVDSVLSFPWKYDRFVKAINNIKKSGFAPGNNIVISRYYYPLEFAVITNGYHHTIIAAIERQGLLNSSNVYNVALTFPHIYADGKYWRSLHTHEVIDKILDFRVAVLYEIYRRFIY